MTTVFIDEHDGTNHCRDLDRRKIAAMKTNFIDDHANINHCRDLKGQKIPAVKTVENSVTESLNVDGEIIIITDSESDGEEQYTGKIVTFFIKNSFNFLNLVNLYLEKLPFQKKIKCQHELHDYHQIIFHI